MALAQRLVRLYQTMAENAQFFAPAVQREFPKVGQDISKMVSILSAVHMTGEQAATFGNPRYYWYCRDEDQVGLSTEVAEQRHVSTLAETVILRGKEVLRRRCLCW